MTVTRYVCPDHPASIYCQSCLDSDPAYQRGQFAAWQDAECACPWYAWRLRAKFRRMSLKAHAHLTHWRLENGDRSHDASR